MFSEQKCRVFALRRYTEISLFGGGTMKRTILTLGLAAVCAAGYSQAVITDGTSSFGWSSATALSGAANRTGTGGGTSNVFRTNGGADQAFQEWWWYRVNGVNNREFALSTQNAAPVVSGNNMTLSYREPEGFSSTLNYTINNISGYTLVTGTNFIKNEGNTTLDFDFFNYIDWDINATAGTDTATLLSGNPALRMRISDPATILTGEYRALDATNYQIGAFATVRGLMTDADVDNFNNTVPNFTGDFTGGVQWKFTLDPGQMIALQTSRVLNPVPEPATMAVLGLGVAALLRRRRK
jgi:PEP-CTERM motif